MARSVGGCRNRRGTVGEPSGGPGPDDRRDPDRPGRRAGRRQWPSPMGRLMFLAGVAREGRDGRGVEPSLLRRALRRRLARRGSASSCAPLFR
ncbi:hypothetical protein FRACA_520001 [Frankia canadensis]|uniref:Uncharacterized protein n=1 Tax=Frankia canadensis TaxID=1836972 RepID=A0A2I2KYK6_9ACTN|nr:hypothetical protein FRACA_520001 [Frankia canadensis]SOU58026.1 hypothetical protein FRACA_520001 [Frankia canadensis]